MRLNREVILNENLETKVIEVAPSIHYINATRRRNLGLLNISSVIKIIRRFLVEKHVPKKVFAKNLGISVRKMEKLFSPKIPRGLRHKINLPLINLYCETEWQ